MHSEQSSSLKILTHRQLMKLRAELRARGETLVQCHGCFDIVHPGHIRHLRFAAAQGDRLIVSVTADAFVNKGPDRPMFPHGLRAENLAALEFVDWVYIHHEPTAVDLLDEIKPDIYIKGAEYIQNNDPRFENERQIVESNSGRVVFSSGDVVYSSTSIVDSIQKASRPDPDIAQLVSLAREHDLSSSFIRRALRAAGSRRVLVVGETIIDTYTQCQWPEVAQEHPMLSLRPVSTEHFDGGAAIVAQHLAAMGLRPILCTPISDQAQSQALCSRLAASGIDLLPVPFRGEMPEKKRYIVGRDKVVKLDCSTRIGLDSAQRELLLTRLDSLDDLSGVIFTDFGLGMFSAGLAGAIASRLAERVELIAGDVSGSCADLLGMRGSGVLCPCESELRRAFNDHQSPIPVLARKLMETTGARAIVVTLGSQGIMLVTGTGAVKMPALSHDPIDTLGCGDAMLASVFASLLGGADLIQAAFVGSLGAAVAGSVIGNIAVASSQIIQLAQTLAATHAHIVAQSEASRNRPAAKNAAI